MLQSMAHRQRLQRNAPRKIRSWPGPGAQRARFPAANLQYGTEARKSAEALRADFHGRFLGGDRKERPQSPRLAGSCGRRDSDLGLFRQLQGVIDLDSEISHSAFNFAVAQEQLHGPQVFRSLVD